jgi:hypothetical protein
MRSKNLEWKNEISDTVDPGDDQAMLGTTDPTVTPTLNDVTTCFANVA